MNIPNILSLIRIAFVPLFCVVYFSDIENSQFFAAGIYTLASFTDILDGYIARKFNMITKLGRILDPMADKMMSFAVLLSIVIKGLVPWWAAAIYFAKELLMAIGAVVQFKKISDVPSSNRLGKFSTVFFFGVCLVVMLFPKIPKFYSSLLIGIALFLTCFAFFFYLKRFFLNTSKKNSKIIK